MFLEQIVLSLAGIEPRDAGGSDRCCRRAAPVVRLDRSQRRHPISLVDFRNRCIHSTRDAFSRTHSAVLGIDHPGRRFWLSYQLYWTYYEVLLRRDVPDLCTWDVILFLHIVPFMAALAIRPHVPRDEYAARIGQLDFALLLVWWFYLYVLIVMPWQYVLPDVPTYNRNLNIVYAAEKIALLAGLVVCWISSKDRGENSMRRYSE